MGENQHSSTDDKDGTVDANAGRSRGGVGIAVDVVKNAYQAFDRRGTGKVSAKVRQR